MMGWPFLKLLNFYVIINLFLSHISQINKGIEEPVESEKINSIGLSGNCKFFKIIEWQKQSQNVEIIDKICNSSFKELTEFASKNKCSLRQGKDLDFKISLLSLGNCDRCLNDINGRFYFRLRHYKDNQIIPIWGYYRKDLNLVFLRDDIGSDEFKLTFLHELFHVFQYQKIIDCPGKPEDLADKFAWKFF